KADGRLSHHGIALRHHGLWCGQPMRRLDAFAGSGAPPQRACLEDQRRAALAYSFTLVRVAARPLARVGDKCLARPMVAMNSGEVARISSAGRSEYTRRIRASRPETIAESLAASKCSLPASPLGTSQTMDWQPLIRYSSVFHSSGNVGRRLPMSIRYW